MAASQDLVLVTGGSGFIGSHTVLQAVQAGYKVRTTVRSLQRADEVRKMLLNGGATQAQVDDVEFVAADLTKDEGWTEACAGCKYVLHVASPFPMTMPKNENDLIIPARDGTLRIFKAAKAAGTVKRIVLTSSIASVAYGHDGAGTKPYTEEDWSEPPKMAKYPYQKSKTLAERAAWEWIEKEGNGIELVTILPSGVLGPVLSKSAGTSVEIVVQMLQGKMPFLPKLKSGWVDVRDVAELHIKSITDEKAAGQRYIATSAHFSLKEMAEVLKAKLGKDASKVSTREVPNMMVRLMAFVDRRADLVVGELENPKTCSNEKAKSAFGWTPIGKDDMIVTAGESCVKYGLV